MDDNTRLLIGHACARCSIKYAHPADRRDDDGFADQFAEDAILELGPARAEGRSNIRAFIAKRPSETVARHMFSNIVYIVYYIKQLPCNLVVIS